MRKTALSVEAFRNDVAWYRQEPGAERNTCRKTIWLNDPKPAAAMLREGLVQAGDTGRGWFDRKQIFRVMKLTIVLMMVGFLNVYATGMSQNISFSGRNVSLETVFSAVEKQSEVVFLYTDPVLRASKPISISVSHMPLAKFLKKLFKDQPLNFSIDGKSIFVSLQPPSLPSGMDPAHFDADIPEDTLKRVSGTVTNENGEPLEGANVSVKGTTKGSVTNAEGRFDLADVDENAILEISFVGYEIQTRAVQGKAGFNIVLNQKLSTLDEAVKIAYGTSSRRLLTSNVVSVKAKDLENQPITSPIVALQGRMAGVEITQLSGMPGAAPQIRIRGQNSIRYDANQPLYIIDGVPVDATPVTTSGFMLRIGSDPLSTLNLANIESIEILKDADATAIYGSRGANGVVLISTKQAKAGKVTAEINAYTGAGRIPHFMEMMNTVQYLQMRREAFVNSNTVPTASNAVDLMTWDTTRYTDWQRELMGGVSNVTSVQAAVGGGTAQTNFRLGTSYQRHGTLFPGDFHYRKLNGFFNINHKSRNAKLETMLSAKYGQDDNHLFSGGSTDIGNAVFLPPNAPALYDESGNLNWESSTWINPVAVMRRLQNINSNTINLNASLGYNFFPGFSAKATMGYTKLNQKELNKTPKSSLNPTSTEASSASLRTTGRSSWIVEPQLMYNRQLGQGTLDVLLGTTFQKSLNDVLFIRGTGFVDESLMENLSTADNVDIPPSSTGATEYMYTAIFGRLSYNWRRKYLLNLTGRRDGSSRFGPGKRFANLGAFGAGWIFSEEPFMQRSLPFLSFGKWRTSYGITGSDQIGDYGYLDTWGTTDGDGGLYPTQLANPGYSWETNNKFELGLELGFLNDRIQLSTSFYNNRSSNQLVGYPLAALTGFTTVQANLPATVQNRGWEFELNTTNWQSRNFRWRSSLNFSLPKNKLIAFPNIEQTSYASSYVVGEPLSIQFLYKFTGLDPKTGFYTVQDVNEDGRYDAADRTIIKNTGRIFFGGLQNSFTYKTFELDFLLEAVRHVARADGRFLNTFIPGGLGLINNHTAGNALTLLLDRWQHEDDDTDIQKFFQGSGDSRYYNYALASDEAYNTDASFVRLKTVSVSYRLPEKFIGKTGLGSVKIYLQGQNIFTLTKYPGWDAQSPYTGAVPALRMITGGAQIRF